MEDEVRMEAEVAEVRLDADSTWGWGLHRLQRLHRLYRLYGLYGLYGLY